MKTLIIYDTTGYVINNITGNYRVPVGVPYLEVDVPEGKHINLSAGVDVSVAPHEVVLEDIPPSEIELVRLEMARNNAEMFETIIMLTGGM